MPKPYSFPKLYDEVKTVSISLLKKRGYLISNQWIAGTVTWSRNGEKSGSVSIQVDMNGESPYLEFDYKYNGVPVKYKVQLVSIASNLGKGMVWYFLCPNTGKRCRKLYLIDTYFLHREAFSGCMYEKQTQSKKYREIEKIFGNYYKRDEINEQLNKKYFKREYAGKETKKYNRLLSKLNTKCNYSAENLEMLIMSR